MKINTLKCPNCGAKLNIRDQTKDIAHCEYCDHNFVLEKEKPPVQYTQTHKTYHNSRPIHTEPKKNIKKSFVIAIVVLSLIPLAIPLIAYFSSSKNFSIEFETDEFIPRNIPESELICAFVEHVFQKPADRVTPGRIHFHSVFKNHLS